MRYERIPLSAEDEDVYLEAYIADPIGGKRRKAILVIPGGSYAGVCSDREGEPIAMAFMPYGYNAFVLHYTVGRKKPFPAQLIEVAQAMVHIKNNADGYGIDLARFFIVGFSAGGHLAASAGVLWKHPAVTAAVDMPYGYNKPTGVMLIYPVISADWHDDTFQNLLCTDTPDAESLRAVSLEKQVDKDSVPAFLVQTTDDESVDARNSLVFARAYSDVGLPYELHMYPHAPHGIALGNAITDCGVAAWNDPAIARWVEHAAYWAERLCEN